MPNVPIVEPNPQTARRIKRLQEAATYYGVHPKTLREWGAAGRITLVRRGPRLLFVDLDELDALDRQVYTVGR